MTAVDRYYLRALCLFATTALAVNLLSPIARGTWGYGLGYWSGWALLADVIALVAWCLVLVRRNFLS